MKTVMYEKALQAQLCYEDLKKRTGLDPEARIIFRVDPKQEGRVKRACYAHNPFPGGLKLVLCSLRKKAVKRLYQKEKVLQTGPAAAALALNEAMAQELGRIRNGGTEIPEVICDVGFSGLQAIRLYMSAYSGNCEFAGNRCRSAIRVDNALNGSFYKYRTKDNRCFSAHVYYEAQKKRMMEILGLQKPADKFTLRTLNADRRMTAKAIRKWNAEELEEAAFAGGACGCVLRTREEWERTEAGSAVSAMPIFTIKKEHSGLAKAFGKLDPKRGPLSGIRVLDLTHIIAGPACTRLLAEQGAEVLLVRRGTFCEQEQAMLELDGWAGKNRIQLDFNEARDRAKVRELIQEADVVVSSYQDGALHRFGLSPEEIHRLNPNVIYASMVCFSDTVWRERPGWAPCAEDITGLSARNGSLRRPKNLNGVPLDYIPGMLLCTGVLKALKLQMTEGGGYTVLGSLTRGGMWLHECTDLWEETSEHGIASDMPLTSTISDSIRGELWKHVYNKVPWTAVGDVYFTTPATCVRGQNYALKNMRFTENHSGFRK